MLGLSSKANKVLLALGAVVLAGCGHAAGKLPPPAASLGSPKTALPFGASGKFVASYNTGMQIGDFVLLYRVTRNRTWLNRAVALAKAGEARFGALAYRIPPGNSEAFGAIYLKQLATLTGYSAEVKTVYNRQRTEYLAFVRSHPARGGSAREWPSGLWSDKEQHYAYIWPFSQLAAVGVVRHNYRAVDALHYYWNGKSWSSAVASPPRKARPTGSIYWDDNAWAALDVQAAYVQTRRPIYLWYLQRDFAFLKSGWSSGRHGFGGVRWVDAPWNHDIASVSTLGLEQVALDLYLDTAPVHNHLRYDYQAWALWAQSWLDRHMRAPDGTLYDHLTPCGRRLCWSVPTPPGPAHKSFSDPLLYIAAGSV